MNHNKIKVVWICHFSDNKTRDHITFSQLYYKWMLQKLFRKDFNKWVDKAIWITNAIVEFEKFNDIDLTIIFPHIAIKGKKQKFSINGINYVCFRSQDDNFISYLKRKLFNYKEREYLYNRKIIKEIVKEISPDIVHVIGAENPYYSISALDIDNHIPSIVSLQTLMSDPDFIKNYPISKEEYEYRSYIESEIIKKCNYIASSVALFKEIILSSIKKNAIFLNMNLALGQDVDLTPVKKVFDFVYFAANISKAADYAIESFALVVAKEKNITLNISGAFTSEYKSVLDNRINELGIKDNVVFTGAQPTHDDVLYQIKKSKYAVLPLKVDQISGTIREAMACGLPVVTTITPATPFLNEKRESVLLSKKGDFQSMADNMLLLLKDNVKAKELSKNAILTVKEMFSNESIMNRWHQAYYAIMENVNEGKPISNSLLL